MINIRNWCVLALALVGMWEPATAQFGLSGRYMSAQADGWTSEVTAPNGAPAVELPGTGWELGLDYWFRLKNKRVEFLPTLSYAQLSKQEGVMSNPVEFSTTQFSLFFHTNFYLLDFNGDCDCPTFSKEGPSLQKGLYLQLSPGVAYFDFEATTPGDPVADQHLALGVGAGLGVDLGLSDLLTLTPLIAVRYFPSVNWENLPGNGEDVVFVPGVEAETSLWQYQVGLRLGLRFDELKPRWRR